MKKRFALLDLLLTATENGETLPDSDVRDEVNNFMFAVSSQPPPCLSK